MVTKFPPCYFRGMKWNVFDPNCPTRQLLDRVADKWTVLVVCSLGEGTKRFGELRRKVGEISPKVLTEILRSLERDGVISRHVFATVPLRVEYRLTPLGRALFQLAQGLRSWAEKNMPAALIARTAYDARGPESEVEVEREAPARRKPEPAASRRRTDRK